jgi:Fuc2NAc and GlcNAc transferase
MIRSAHLTVVISAAATWVLLWALIPSLQRLLLDHPNERSCHSQATPRGGGAAFVFIGSLASALAFWGPTGVALAFYPLVVTLLLTLPLALVGFLDDRHNLAATWRYCVQLATALVVVLGSPLVAKSGGLLPLLAMLLIAVTAVINFTNFMDGLDGLVAGCMAVAMTAAAIQVAAPWPIWALVGALLGFLLWNWSPAKVFMGDVGSTYLGAVFCMLVLRASTWPEALALVLLATPLLGDACLCVLRRLMAGQRVFQAHRLHLYQRLHQAGWPHARVSSLYVLATVVLSISLLWGGLPWVITLASVELLIGIFLDQQVAVPFAEASNS